MNDRLYIKIKENIDKYQSLYLIRNVTKKIIPDNYVESFEKFGFNLVSNLQFFRQILQFRFIPMLCACVWASSTGPAYSGQRNYDEQSRNRDRMFAQVSRVNENFIR